MIKLITDSSADLPQEMIEKHDITVVPLTVSVGGQEYLEGIDLTSQKFFQKMFATEELPKTSQPSPSSFADVFSKYNQSDTDILCFTISSGLSGTYQAACLGKEISKAKVTVFDTLAGSLGHGLQIIRAAELAEKGYPLETIVKELEQYRSKMNILILLDTLENIVKGGRLSKFQGSLAKILNIKVILEGISGRVEILEKIRGRKKFQKRAIEIISEREKDFSNVTIGITHTGNIEAAEAIKQRITEQFQPKDIIINYMGATMGTYAGKDGIIISF